MTIKQYSERHPTQAAFVLLLIAFCLRILDAFVIRTDELIGEQVIPKVGGLIVILVYVWLVKGNLAGIGFHGSRWKTSLVLGFLFMAIGLACGYLVEWLYLQLAGESPSLLAAAESHPVFSGEAATSGLLLVFILIVGNFINSAMEEGLFRGVMITHLGSRMSMVRANLIQAALFGVWHTTVPLRAYLDGQMDLPMAVIGSLVYVLLSGMVGFVWGVFYQKTNSIWTSWSAHTLNNTTLNFVHITTAAGMPSTMPLRVTVIALVMVGLLPLFKKWTTRLEMSEVVPWI